MTREVSSCIAAGLMALAATTAMAQQNYPTRAVRLVVPSVPGGGTDITARIMAPRLSEYLGQQVVVENRGGAATMIGGEVVARAAPDGHTLLMGISTLAINAAMFRKVPYDALKDFAPISFVASVPYVLVVDPSLPVNSVDQLIKLAKSAPGKMNFASAGNGSTHQFCGELLKSMAGIDMVHVPYKGSPPAIAGLLGGEVQMMFANLTDIGSQLRSGRVKALGVTTPKRAPLLPEVPTLDESGLPGFEIESWFGLLAPAGTPAPIIARLNAETLKVLARDDVRQALNAQGLQLEPGTPEQFAAHIKSEIAKFTRIARAAGIKAE